jgi:hypothetical protein
VTEYKKPEHVDVNPDSPEIVAAAKWWRESLQWPKFDNGDRSNTGLMAESMARMGHKIHDEEVLKRFEIELRSAIAARYNEKKNWHPSNPEFGGYGRVISVDYHADPILTGALEGAGGKANSMLSFPWKTTMHVGPGKVTVACGYGAPYQTIYQKEAVK